MTKHKDISGQRYGRLLILREAGSRHNGRITWLAVCDCGQEKVTTLLNLSNGTRSCGCLLAESRSKNGELGSRRTHGLTGTKAFRAWVGMRDRCSNPNAEFYADYGGRGIAICERWQSVENFVSDMGDPPAGMSLDRIDVNGNYEPGNCRWATATEQNRNRRNNVLFTFDGETRCLAEWAEKAGLREDTLRARLIVRKWPIERALTTRPGEKRNP
jgi:hypothetical protein